MTPEKVVQNSIIKYFNNLIKENHPLMFERRQAGGLSYKKGTADLWAVYNGRHIEIEIKKLNGKRTPMQEKWELECRKSNTLYCLANSLQVLKDFMKINFNIQD